jgi:hypothetical protein
MFESFPKIGRLNREVVVTEKIDGMNAQIFIKEQSHPSFLWSLRKETFISHLRKDGAVATIEYGDKLYAMWVGSRNKWLSHHEDVNGFHAWATANSDQLWKLGKGRHFGEWWGSGVGRNYGLAKGEKRFSLFNTSRWCEYGQIPEVIFNDEGLAQPYQTTAPKCCRVVPILARGLGIDILAKQAMGILANEGSKAAPGYMNPEGVIIFHTGINDYFKVTIHKDEQPKSKNKKQ